MPQGRKTALVIRLTDEERQTLMAWQRSQTIRVGYARRGRIILLLAEGKSITETATMAGSTRRFVYKWVRRFLHYGVEGLAGKPRLRHGPTGLMVIAEESRSQHENKAKALKRIRQALFLHLRDDLTGVTAESLATHPDLADGLPASVTRAHLWPAAGVALRRVRRVTRQP